MQEPTPDSYQLAIRDFKRARKAAVLQQVLARIKGQSINLLDYETTLKNLKPVEEPIPRGLSEIPLHKIVGSVGRFQDFTSDFLPKHAHDETRWAHVKKAFNDMAGLPPIEVYQIGDAYFVLDGNHRVSVARQLGSGTISAFVTEVKTRVSLSANDDVDKIICKANYADFLEKTGLDQSCPDIDLSMTICGQYQTLLDQIDVQHQTLLDELNPNQEVVSRTMAAADWYSSVYLPILQVIRELGVLQRFPIRTATDIYVLLSQQKASLEESLGWQLNLKEDLPRLIEEKTKQGGLVPKVVDSVIPALGETGQTGVWRSQQLAMHREERLFSDILVLFEGIDEDWDLLDVAIWLAVDDNDRLLALHIVDTAAQLESPAVLEMAARFQARCRDFGLVGEFAAEAGNHLSSYLKRAVWSDLVLASLTEPPISNPLARLRSFWGPMIEQCPRPLLITTHANAFNMSPMLLAYDGSPKSDEALFLATYHAGRWKNELTVLTVHTPSNAESGGSTLSRAKTYLEDHGVYQANYILDEGEVGQTIIKHAVDNNSNLIIMGGFGLRPAKRMIQGSSIEFVLQHMTQTLLICR